jgi:hypothetical protein
MSQTNPVRQDAKRPMGSACRPRQSRWFGNHHDNCVGTHDVRYAATGLQRGKPLLQCFVCQKPHNGTTYQLGVATCPQAETALFQKDCTGEEEFGSTCTFATSPEVRPGATVGTLQTRYPHIHAPNYAKK